MSSDEQIRKLSDTGLVDACVYGDAVAWRELVRRYGRLIHSVPVRYGLTPMEVDDVGQEVFLILAQNLHQIEDPERLSAWLLTTTRRVTWRVIQKRKQEQAGDQGNLLDEEHSARQTLTNSHSIESDYLGSVVPSIQQLIDGWTYQRVLNEGLSRLDARCQRLLTLLFLDTDEPTYEEISEALGMPLGSIGPTRNRCLHKLRQILEGLGHSDLLHK